MSTRVNQGVWALTEKEKQTLRLIVRGHDAKSTARTLNLSVHTINERLRDARRKLAVSSSREAARMLLEAEGGAAALDPQSLGDSRIGADSDDARAEEGGAPAVGAARAMGSRPIILGVLLMSFALGLLAIAGLTPVAAPQAPATSQEAPNPAAVEAARAFLALLDESRWNESYAAFGPVFQKMNSAQVWADVSEKVRKPLGAATSRTFLSQENLPAPPAGYEVVKFRTSFAGKANAVETVTLDRVDGRWVVVGVTVG